MSTIPFSVDLLILRTDLRSWLSVGNLKHHVRPSIYVLRSAATDLLSYIAFPAIGTPPLIPYEQLSADELFHPQPVIVRRRAREQLEQHLEVALPCDESFRVGRDC